MAVKHKKVKGEKKARPVEAPAVPPAPPLNPYVHLRKQAGALLRLEAMIHPDRREQCQWQLLQHFCGTAVMVGKGGANTCMWIFDPQGGGKRHVGFPAQLMEVLDRMSRQSHWLYRIEANGKQRQLFSIKKMLKREPPAIGAKIYGITSEGVDLVYVARQNAAGRLAWIKK